MSTLVGYTRPASGLFRYKEIREQLGNPDWLPLLFGSSYIEDIPVPLMMSFYGTHIQTSASDGTIRRSKIFGSVIDIQFSQNRSIFDGCWFSDCIFVLGGSRANHSIFYNCDFDRCTFLYDTNTTRADTFDLFGLCRFDGGSRSAPPLFDQDKQFGLGAYFSDFVLPAPGKAFTAWKKVLCFDMKTKTRLHDVLLKLDIPCTAYRLRGISGGRKIRLSTAYVAEAYAIMENPYLSNIGVPEYPHLRPLSKDTLETLSLRSYKDENFRYGVGQHVFPDKFDETIGTVCTNGIHCFANQDDAITYQF